MRNLLLAMVVLAGSAITFPATAQQQQTAPEMDRMHGHTETGVQAEPNQQVQRDADKGVNTRNSGESGYVADEDKPGASAHPPGRPETTGSSSQTGAPK
jgi:hypothetical protein